MPPNTKAMPMMAASASSTERRQLNKRRDQAIRPMASGETSCSSACPASSGTFVPARRATSSTRCSSGQFATGRPSHLRWLGGRHHAGWRYAGPARPAGGGLAGPFEGANVDHAGRRGCGGDEDDVEAAAVDLALSMRFRSPSECQASVEDGCRTRQRRRSRSRLFRTAMNRSSADCEYRCLPVFIGVLGSTSAQATGRHGRGEVPERPAA